MKLKSFFNQYGILAIPRLLKAILRRVGIITETFLLLKYELNEMDVINKFNEYDYSDVKEIIKNDISKISFLNSDKIKIFKNRFHYGNYSCYAIVKDKEIQYLTWISWECMNYPTFFKKKEKLKFDQALLEDSFCSP